MNAIISVFDKTFLKELSTYLIKKIIKYGQVEVHFNI
jgi:hypothetical protein